MVENGKKYHDKLQKRTFIARESRGGMVTCQLCDSKGEPRRVYFEMWWGLWKEKMSNYLDQEGKEVNRIEEVK